jgi:hypothetical protein
VASQGQIGWSAFLDRRADPFPLDDPLPRAYELHPAADGLPISYTIAPYDRDEVISIQHLTLNT